MAKQDRKDHLLSVLVDIDAALPAAVLWRNARLRGATYGRTSAKTYLRELVEEGYVQKLDPEVMGADRQRAVVGPDATGYYEPTESGRSYIRSDS